MAAQAHRAEGQCLLEGQTLNNNNNINNSIQFFVYLRAN
jgi:hypothetical protein